LQSKPTIEIKLNRNKKGAHYERLSGRLCVILIDDNHPLFAYAKLSKYIP
jgi:hypothetical protein